MFSRKNEEQEGKDFPQEWTQEVYELLYQEFQSECESRGKNFFVMGKIFSDELVLIVSYLSEKNLQDTPISFFYSFNIFTEKDVKKTLPKIFDIVVGFLDMYFSNEDEFEFTPYWLEETMGDTEFFYKVSRENIQLTLEAEELLKKNSMH